MWDVETLVSHRCTCSGPLCYYLLGPFVTRTIRWPLHQFAFCSHAFRCFSLDFEAWHLEDLCLEDVELSNASSLDTFRFHTPELLGFHT